MQFIIKSRLKRKSGQVVFDDEDVMKLFNHRYKTKKEVRL